MRCREARKKLTELRGQLSPPSVDRDLQEHLKTCLRCSRLTAAERLLTDDFDRLGQARVVICLDLLFRQAPAQVCLACGRELRDGYGPQSLGDDQHRT